MRTQKFSNESCFDKCFSIDLIDLKNAWQITARHEKLCFIK